MKSNAAEILATVSLVATAVLLLNPFHFWMPDMVVMGMLAFAIALFGALAVFVLREKPIDERDEAHRSLAGRYAFLSGSGVLVLGIVVQGYAHAVDPWLVVALMVMAVTKIAARSWSDIHG
jgi:hypothetical protein